MQITSLEQVPAGLTFLLKKMSDLEAMVCVNQSNQIPQAAPDTLKFYTRKEVAGLFQVSLTTLDGYIHDGKIVATRFGTRVRFTREAIDEAMTKIQPAKKIA